jgi:hypothetical protein
MRGQGFDGPESVREFLMDLWRNLDPSMLMSVHYAWIERFQKMIGICEDYYSK